MKVGIDKHVASTLRRNRVAIRQAVRVRSNESMSAVWRWEEENMRQPCREET